MVAQAAMITDYSRIPLEMRQEPKRWALWKYEERDGRLTKVPYRLDGRRAASTNPNDWASFPEACAAHIRLRDSDGLGFRLGDGWAGVDMDKVRDPETNETQEWAWDVIGLLDSYTEISPSLTGWKVFCKGYLPKGRNKIMGLPDYMGGTTGALEAYDSGRYFTLTGLGVSPSELTDRSTQLIEFHERWFPERIADPVQHIAPPPTLEDTQVISKMLGARNGSAIWKLWNGDTSAYGSKSEADLALVNHIAFYVGRNPARIDSIFRQSKLYRDKWDERHGEETYGAMTIAKALAEAREFYSQRSTSGVRSEGLHWWQSLSPA